MSAIIIDGKALAGQIKEEVKAKAESFRKEGIIPKLAVLLVGDDPASVFYARSKVKMGAGIGIDVELIEKPSDTPEGEVLKIIEELNNNPYVHGIMVELPLPKHINKDRVMSHIHYLKDVDAVTPMNRGYLLSGEEKLVPATPLACIEILKRMNIDIVGKRVCIIGRGETVGKPLAIMLIKRHATITVCHTKTKDLPSISKQAEIVIAAAGKANLVTADMIAPGTVVIDAGINEVEPGKYVGDVDFDAVKEIASYITPVPGGVGSMTTTLMMNNVLTAIEFQRKS